MSWSTRTHDDAGRLADAVATEIDAAIAAALRERGQALLALAGGRTSPPVFRRLAAHRRDWSQVTVLPSDERWVSADHPDCNLRQMREAFAGADDVRWLSLTPALPQGAANAAFANGALASHPQDFDVCMLGMGADGHIASLFPGAPNLAAALDPGNREAAVAIVPDPMPSAGPHARVSLTLARLLKSRRLLLVVTGDDKRRVIERARAGDGTLPVAALLAAAHPAAEIHWSP